MNLQALKTELLAGHPVTGAYSAAARIAAAQMMAVNVSEVGAISITELREWASENGRAYKLSQGQTTGATDQVKSLAIIGISILNSGIDGLDPRNPFHVSMVNELVAGGVWSAADKAALIAKATRMTSRAAQLGLGRVRTGEVERARIR